MLSTRCQSGMAGVRFPDRSNWLSACHRCDDSSEICCSGAKPRLWAPLGQLLVTLLGVPYYREFNEDLIFFYLMGLVDKEMCFPNVDFDIFTAEKPTGLMV